MLKNNNCIYDVPSFFFLHLSRIEIKFHLIFDLTLLDCEIFEGWMETTVFVNRLLKKIRPHIQLKFVSKQPSQNFLEKGWVTRYHFVLIRIINLKEATLFHHTYQDSRKQGLSSTLQNLQKLMFTELCLVSMWP